jgi:uncharacterized damage-inducible protein DinB
MTSIDEHGRPEPPVNGDELATLMGFLEYQRATFAWKVDGLDAAGLAATVGKSSMTLGGMVKHLTHVEHHWFSRRLHEREAPPWDSIDWTAEIERDWTTAAADPPEQLVARWQDAVARSRVLADEALADGGLDHVTAFVWPDGPRSLRWVLCHLIEEYARHNGHADLLRESIDGATGE